MQRREWQAERNHVMQGEVHPLSYQPLAADAPVSPPCCPAERSSAPALASTACLTKMQAILMLRKAVGGQEKILEVM